MKKIICKTYEEMSAVAAFTVALQVQTKPSSVLGLATGSTPVGTYRRLAELYADKFVDFSKVTTFNLDEYYPLNRDNPQSYFYFMKENLFKFINIPADNINIPDGQCTDPAAECKAYDSRLAEYGGTDLQILGIGNNGHIAFIEPGEQLPQSTQVVNLAADTIEANSRFFDNADAVPKQALSMGLSGIFGSKHILLLISGKGKAAIAKKLFNGTVTTQIPASLLNLHPNVTVIMDSDAAS
jgi:glucosamine-6-phosphate deaminase